ncbi:MAG: hypothetical protein HXY34_02275 [Candidatus Thorarchaeota archaeon]|nr:hypothetical protein [Candidatus Thorarchaeota archaeon]
MKLPVCVFDLESDMLCPSCQSKLDSGEISEFDVEFSRWMLERMKGYPELDDVTLLRAVKAGRRIVLLVKKKNKELMESAKELLTEIRDTYGEPLILEGPMKLRTAVRTMIYPAVEVGVNSLYLPDGHRESIVMLKAEDEPRIPFTKSELRTIVSAVVGEQVLFEFQEERKTHGTDTEIDAFGEKMKEFSQKRAQ